MVIYDLSILPTSTAFVSSNAKIRHTSFEVCRISENCPLEHCSNGIPFSFGGDTQVFASGEDSLILRLTSELVDLRMENVN